MGKYIPVFKKFNLKSKHRVEIKDIVLLLKIIVQRVKTSTNHSMARYLQSHVEN